MADVCDCGHPWADHGRVEGFDCTPGVTINDQSRVPTVWVCSGVRLSDVNAKDWSPWDAVCGCLIREDEPEAALLERSS